MVLGLAGDKAMIRRIFFLLLLISLPYLVSADSSNALDALKFAPPDSDKSVIYLASIFGIVGNVLHGVGSQIMAVMFGVFNAAVLALGGIIVTYTMLVSTLNTANDGEVMGKKWSSIWIPMRSAVGVSLLLPQTTGYSFIQVFIMWVVVQGIGAADKVWEAALNYIVGGGIIIQASFNPAMDTGGPSSAAQNLDNMMRMVICVKGLQVKLDQARNVAMQQNVYLPPVPLLSQALDLSNVKLNDKGEYVRKVPNLSGEVAQKLFNGVCGTMTWKPLVAGNDPDQKDYNPYSGEHASDVAKKDARTLAFQQVLSNMSDAVDTIISNYQAPNPLAIGHCPTGKNEKCDYATWNEGDGPALLEGSLMQHLYADYVGIISPAVRGMAGKDVQKWVREAKEDGWIMAGSYYYDLSQINNNAGVNVSEFPTVNIDYTAQNFCGTATNPKSPFKILPKITKKIQDGCLELKYWIFGDDNSNTKDIGDFIHDSIYSYQLPNSRAVGDGSNTTAGSGSTDKSLSKVLGVVGRLGGYLQNLAKTEETNENPLFILAKLGNNMLDIVTALWFVGLYFAAVAAGLAAAPWVNLGIGVSVLVAWLMPFFNRCYDHDVYRRGFVSLLHSADALYHLYIWGLGLDHRCYRGHGCSAFGCNWRDASGWAT